MHSMCAKEQKISRDHSGQQQQPRPTHDTFRYDRFLSKLVFQRRESTHANGAPAATSEVSTAHILGKSPNRPRRARRAAPPPRPTPSALRRLCFSARAQNPPSKNGSRIRMMRAVATAAGTWRAISRRVAARRTRRGIERREIPSHLAGTRPWTSWTRATPTATAGARDAVNRLTAVF